MTPTIHILTLGCKTNQCDGEAIGRALAARGYAAEIGVESEDTLNTQRFTLNDIYIVNTCTVTSVADAKARKLVRRIMKDHPGVKVIVTGCYAQRAADELGRLGAVVVANEAKGGLLEVVGRLVAAQAEKNHETKEQLSRQDAGDPAGWKPALHRTRAFVKVQDGCNHACAYCIVHTVRGPMTSMPTGDVVAEVARLAAAGVKEVVLCGVHLGAYGVDLPGGARLADLLHALRSVPMPRLRLSSLEPMDLPEPLIAEFADHPSLCHHLHLPLQSGDDGVLKAMARGYRIADYAARVEKIRSVWPDLSLTTDIMVGLPGESDAAFENTLAAARQLDFSHIHVFRYSPRPGTPAASMPNQVAEIVKRRRSEALQELAEELFRGQAQRLIGRTVEVLFEERDAASGRWKGLTAQYLRAEVESREELTGEIRRVVVTTAEESSLLGAIEREAPRLRSG